MLFRRTLRLALVGALAATTLVMLGGSDVASGQGGPVGYTVGTNGFAGDPECEFWSIDLATGATTQVSESGTDDVLCADGLTFAPDGTLYAYTNAPFDGVVDAQLVTINLADGAQTPVGPLPAVHTFSGGMTFDAAGNLWLYAASVDPANEDCGTDFTEVCLWQVDPATAATTFVGGIVDNAATVLGLAGNCTPEVLALTGPPIDGIESGAAIQRVDTATAGIDLVVDLPETFFPQGLDYDSAGELWALAGQPRTGIGPMEVENIDLATGDVTHTQLFVDEDPFGGFLTGLAISPISCPVPPTPEPVVIQPTFTG